MPGKQKYGTAKSPFTMRGYTYPGTSPLHDNEKTKKGKKVKKEDIDTMTHEEEIKELHPPEYPEPDTLGVPPGVFDGSVTDTAKIAPIRNYKKGYY